MKQNHHSICMKDEVTALLYTSGRTELIGNIDSEYKSSRSGYDDAVSIALTGFKLAFLKKDGTVGTRWYADYYMDYYDAHTDSYRDVYDTSNWSNITALCAGDDHIVGLTSGGRVYATGNNDKGQCNVSGWTNIVDITAGGDTTIGLRSDGTVVAAGDNQFGMCNARIWKNIKRIFAGPYSVIGIKNDGTLVTTQKNWEQELSGWTDIVDLSICTNAVIGVRSNGRVSVICENADFKEKVEQWSNIINAVIEWDTTEYYAIGLRSNGKLVSLGSGFWDDTFTDKRIDVLYKDTVMTPDGTVAREDKSDYAFSSSHSSNAKVSDIFYTILGFIIIIIMFVSCNQ